MTLNQPKNILQKYWGFDSFRDRQLDIIESILSGRDTLGLLPTGGGKSICFQVPALCMDGVCVVVTPLVALMLDQVANLKKRGVKAVAVHSGMTKRQIDYALDNVAYGGYKFLYLSPERLKTHLFKERLKKMNVSFIAVDEAHCVSQWGYDFRPAYLEINALRKLLPQKPVLALTATATSRVVLDIQDKLAFHEQNVIQKSFIRENLRYFVKITDDKMKTLLAVVNKQKGSGIVYVRNRRSTVEISKILNRNGCTSTYFHAGLSLNEREKKQSLWQRGETRIMVATNAFGMGIDKSDVRFVVNIDLPESLEAYFQEAGRAGRDENKAYAILLSNKEDRLKLEEGWEKKFPELEEIKRIYSLVMNEFRLAIGAGQFETYSFSWDRLNHKSDFSVAKLLNAAKFIERAGYWQLSEGLKGDSEVMILQSPKDIYSLQLQYPNVDKVIQVLLRSYGGVFDGYVSIQEATLAKRSNLSVIEIKKVLRFLMQLDVIDYKEITDNSHITLLQPRIDPKNLRLPLDFYERLKSVDRGNREAVINYAFSGDSCRTKMLLKYFGEQIKENCGTCDYCIDQSKYLHVSNLSNEKIVQKLKDVLRKKDSIAIADIVGLGKTDGDRKKLQFTITWMVDNGIILVNDINELELVN